VSVALQNPVVVVPGIIATALLDEYPPEPQQLWTMVLHQEYERLSLHPDDPRYEAFEPARVVPGRLFGLAYDNLIGALRHDLTPKRDRPTPVFAFPYDWRQELEHTAVALDGFVEEVIARTRLLKHYAGFDAHPAVDLVGHSMGGLVICEYLHRFGARRRVGKIATLGTPFAGSIEAVVQLLTGMGNLSGHLPSEREREWARSTPSIYHLLPSYAGAVLTTPGVDLPRDLFRPDAWQPSILESIAEYVRLHSASAGNRASVRLQARALFESLLGRASAHRQRVEHLDLAAAGLGPDDWLVIVGADVPTRTHLVLTAVRGRPRFALRDHAWVNDYPASRETGDGTVPLPGAMPAFVDEDRLVTVVPADFDLLELRDRVLVGAAGFHALLPNLDLAQRLILRHLRPTFHGDVWGRPIPGVALRSWQPPISGLAAARRGAHASLTRSRAGANEAAV